MVKKPERCVFRVGRKIGYKATILIGGPGNEGLVNKLNWSLAWFLIQQCN